MNKYVKLLILIAFIILAVCVQYHRKVIFNDSEVEKIFKFTRNPNPQILNIEKMDVLPEFNPKSIEDYEIDLIGKDLSNVNLDNRYDDLMYARFNKDTIWSGKLPQGFNPLEIMENGKNPGLDTRDLHKQGVNGKGIGIAIIDSALLVNHIEYKDNLKYYEEINLRNYEASYHGLLVASIAVGKTVGVAPDADLYFIATESTDSDGKISYMNTAEAIDRVLEINKSLSERNKIRVISISNGWIEGQKGYTEITAAINRAKEEEIFVISSMLLGDYGYFFDGLGRNPANNTNNLSSYEPNILYRDYYYTENNIYKFFENRALSKFKLKREITDILYVPMDSRTFASPFGEEDYIFERRNGWSVCSPYLAGLYALACQVYPNVTPNLFWETSLKTGDSITFTKNNKQITMERIINPKRLIESLKNYEK